MNISTYIEQVKPQLLAHIKQQCEDLGYDDIPYSTDIGHKLYEYTSRGKLLRGIFLCLSAESFGKPLDNTVLEAAAALEIAQSAILMHDDVMDQDDIRRGKPSMHKIYQIEGFSAHIANSLSICLGDVGLFHAFRYLSGELSQLFSRELTKTAMGQTYDVMQAALNTEISQESILSIIRNKTANYTFILPFLSGLILANAQTEELQIQIRELGELMGFVFQVRDDELNYLATQQTGKSSGGDIRENKKTLCRVLLIDEHPELLKLYGLDQYIDRIKDVYIKSETKRIIDNMINDRITIAKGIINQLPISVEYNNIWFTILEYLYSRKF